jgi:probable F420-dependent oxidoreductase
LGHKSDIILSHAASTVKSAHWKRVVELGTGIALAFPRSPMQVAYTAWDLQALSGGRFILGLGSQVRAHVERRFGAPGSHPARRMREYVLALRAIWDAWSGGSRLDFRGEFYRHTLMPPAFHPRGNPHGPPRVFLAAVRERMVEVAGEVADGLIVHPFQSERYLRQTIVPALERGLRRGGHTRGDFELALALFTATDETESTEIRRRIAFYGSTPGYRGVLDAHGWTALFEELHRLSRSDGWESMPALISDEILDTLAVRGADASTVARVAVERYGQLVDRINFHAGATAEPSRWAEIARAMRGQAKPSP